MPISSLQCLTIGTGREPLSFCTVRFHHKSETCFIGRNVLVVVVLVDVAGRGPVYEVDVMGGARGIEAPVRGVGEHDLLLEAELLALEERPFVRRAYDGLASQTQVCLDRQLRVEAGFLHPDDVGDRADIGQALSAHDDPELRGVVEHDRERRGVCERPDVVDDLPLGLGDEVRSGDDQQVESGALGVVGQDPRFPQ